MSRYLLDTNILIAAIKGAQPVRQRLEVTALSDLILSPIVLGELKLGVEKSAQREKNGEKLVHVVSGLPFYPLEAGAVEQYARIRALLESRGTPIGGNDYWIAAQARAMDAVVVTDNQREFQRVPGLRLENWLT